MAQEDKGGAESQTVAEPSAGVAETKNLGPCVTCGEPGAVKAKFPWTADEPTFCQQHIPAHYRAALNV